MIPVAGVMELISIVETMSISTSKAQLLIRSLPSVVGGWSKGILRQDVLRCGVPSSSA